MRTVMTSLAAGVGFISLAAASAAPRADLRAAHAEIALLEARIDALERSATS